MAFVTPVVEHWLEQGIAQWVHHEGSIQWPIAPWVNTTMELYLTLRTEMDGRKEGNVLFNDTLNIFYLRLYGVIHMVKDHSDSERGNPPSQHFQLAARVLLYASSDRQDSTYHGLCYTSHGALAGTRNTQWVHPMKDRSDNPSHHEWTLYHGATSRSFATWFELTINRLPYINILKQYIRKTNVQVLDGRLQQYSHLLDRVIRPDSCCSRSPGLPRPCLGTCPGGRAPAAQRRWGSSSRADRTLRTPCWRCTCRSPPCCWACLPSSQTCRRNLRNSCHTPGHSWHSTRKYFVMIMYIYIYIFF